MSVLFGFVLGVVFAGGLLLMAGCALGVALTRGRDGHVDSMPPGGGDGQ